MCQQIHIQFLICILVPTVSPATGTNDGRGFGSGTDGILDSGPAPDKDALRRRQDKSFCALGIQL